MSVNKSKLLDQLYLRNHVTVVHIVHTFQRATNKTESLPIDDTFPRRLNTDRVGQSSLSWINSEAVTPPECLAALCSRTTKSISSVLSVVCISKPAFISYLLSTRWYW